jgi:hypothetical protein
MPWAAIPFDQLSYKDELSTRFGVVGVPSVIVISLTDGLVKDRDARSTIYNSNGDYVRVMAQWERDNNMAESKRGEGKDDDDDKDEK